MELIKNHYEKIILSLVLAALAVAAGYLPIEVSNVRQSLQEATRSYERPQVEPLPALDLSTNEAALARLRHPLRIAFAAPGHNIFNSLRWIKSPNGLIPEEDFGVRGLAVEKIVPLYTRIEYIGPRDTGFKVRYQFRVAQEASTNRVERRPRLRLMAVGDKNKLFTLRQVVGDPKNPKGVVIEIVDHPEPVTLSTNKPFSEIAGYAADLRHTGTNRRYSKVRVGDRIIVGRAAYNIVAIGPSDVTLEDSQTRKRTTIKANGIAAGQ